MIFPIRAPNTTANRDVRTSAEAEPRNTDRRELLSAEKAKVASWVLSPSSARNTMPKVVSIIFKSIVLTRKGISLAGSSIAHREQSNKGSENSG